MGRRIVLKNDQREKVKALRAEVDEHGKQKWTYQAIAEALGVSIGTVQRAATGAAGYAPKVGKELSAAGAAVRERMRLMEAVGLDDTGVDYLLEQRQRERELGITGELYGPASV